MMPIYRAYVASHDALIGPDDKFKYDGCCISYDNPSTNEMTFQISVSHRESSPKAIATIRHVN